MPLHLLEFLMGYDSFMIEHVRHAPDLEKFILQKRVLVPGFFRGVYRWETVGTYATKAEAEAALKAHIDYPQVVSRWWYNEKGCEETGW